MDDFWKTILLIQVLNFVPLAAGQEIGLIDEPIYPAGVAVLFLFLSRIATSRWQVVGLRWSVAIWAIYLLVVMAK